MSEQTTPSDTVHSEQTSTSSACCAAITELRARAEQAAALRAGQATPSTESSESSPAPVGGA
ncbi:hypothetical protein OHU07_30850 [Streptomyces phaeochromogenes]|uniref:hypothetical protein n=1 Tax=Streptomyces phaeochromogenes TaxID=1923 RepID=UPI002E2B2F4E|nr:hypothetical protein [Streptomyces phaeochromogenes]